MKTVSKGRFLATLECPLLGWGLRHEIIEAIPDDDHFSKFLATQGHLVGEIATDSWNNYLSQLGFDPRHATVHVDHELARLNITREDPQKWLEASVAITKRALDNPNIRTIYEATVSVDQYSTRADILFRPTSAPIWQIIELKSITSYNQFTSVPSHYSGDNRRKYVDDMAYTNMVFKRAGITISGVYLLNINKDCTEVNYEITDQFPVNNSYLNKSEDLYPNVLQATVAFEAHWDSVRDITGSDDPPAEIFSLSCKHCAMCNRIFDADNNNLLHMIPFANSGGSLKNKLCALIGSNEITIEEIPDNYFSGASIREQNAAVITRSIKENKPYLRITGFDGGLPRLLSSVPNDPVGLKWPAIYLDFEFIGTAVPLWSEQSDADGNLIRRAVRPYEAIPVQYSLHLSKSLPADPFAYPIHMPDEPCEHRSFICKPGHDVRLQMGLQLAKDLQEVTASAGVSLADCSVFVWHQTAELTCLNYFIGGTSRYPEPYPWLPPWAVETLRTACHNMVDLLNIVRGGKTKPSLPNFRTDMNYYHPSFRGSFSLKNVVKMFGDDNPYANSNITTGAEAFAKYGQLCYSYSNFQNDFWTPNTFTDAEAAEILRALDKYCFDDTHSLFRVHKSLVVQTREALAGSRNYLDRRDIDFRL